MYRICKTIEIESGHQLSKHPDKCRFPHGHTRKVEIELEAAELDANDMVCDFKIVKEVIGDYLESLDHSLCVNTADPMFAKLREVYGERIVPFENEDPTTEVLARVIHDAFARKLEDYRSRPDSRYPMRPEVRIVRIRVWETSSSWAEYHPH
ncbi:MAG: 6-pyruvoyltetrahydropterin/6-carboxytetrahydropterin synthase [Verrucomicrobia bacterium]|nr:MAG: 6-pyruvoyltetrahydropterin/6-carboxytetrahydropterin synthase [Verrucomicrobiota bacterium]